MSKETEGMISGIEGYLSRCDEWLLSMREVDENNYSVAQKKTIEAFETEPVLKN